MLIRGKKIGHTVVIDHCPRVPKLLGGERRMRLEGATIGEIPASEVVVVARGENLATRPARRKNTSE